LFFSVLAELVKKLCFDFREIWEEACLGVTAFDYILW